MSSYSRFVRDFGSLGTLVELMNLERFFGFNNLLVSFLESLLVGISCPQISVYFFDGRELILSHSSEFTLGVSFLDA